MKRVYWSLALAAATLGCRAPGGADNLPPSAMLMHPGPGVDGPGPGVLYPEAPGPLVLPASQLDFAGPEGAHVAWDVSAPGLFDAEPIVMPGRYNFPQGALYRLKLTNIPGRPGIELYPTVEVAPVMPRTDAYLAHNAIPIQFTEEDLDQVTSGNFVTKVLYLPDPEFQELAVAGVGTLVSTKLDPGLDPIVEADRMGSILAIVRIGNKDLTAAGGEGELIGPGGEGGMFGPGGMGPDGMGGPGGPGDCGPGGMGAGMGPGGMGSGADAAMISGVSAPEWGMPMSGTPIGLPGPPHIPLGIPAGLQKHVIRNHTHVDLPKPTREFKIDVKQRPGMSYPKPVNRMHISERAVPEKARLHQPPCDTVECVQ